MWRVIEREGRLLQTNGLLLPIPDYCLAITLFILHPEVLCHMEVVSSIGATWLVMSLGNVIC